MNRTDLAIEIAKETGLSEVDAENAIKAFVDVVAQELQKGGKVQLAGFGTFEVTTRAAREGVNPYTREAMEIPESKSPKFKASKALKDIVKEGN
ncbi:MAG: HU family DNA-binding protein [Lachnospiraceae bacterium]|nr:HU family DNA-binding protein [Lachnospiraceae bacterium]